MKKILISLSIILSLSLFTSCDIIDAPYEEDVEIIDTNDSQKRVLIIEFTGIKCNNCPPASEEAHRIIEKYEGKVIGLNIHASDLARPSSPSEPNFRNNTSNNIYTATNRPGLPAALISKFLDINSISNAFVGWENSVVEILEQEADIEILMKKDGDRNYFEVEFFKQLSGQFRIASYVIENGIIGYQLGPTKSYYDYEHNYVLRTNILGDLGQDIDLTTINQNKIEVDFNIPSLDESWVTENIEIVTFVYEVENGDVLQVNKFSLPN